MENVRTESDSPSDAEEINELLGHLNADAPANVVLKGHLLIEEKLSAALDKFVFHGEFLEDARLTFAQKLALCRSISLDRGDDPIWDLIAKLNKLRNALSHSLDGERRANEIEAILLEYANVLGCSVPDDERANQSLMLTCVVALCLGFISTFRKEIGRFKEYVDELDKVANPHRLDEN